MLTNLCERLELQTPAYTINKDDYRVLEIYCSTDGRVVFLGHWGWYCYAMFIVDYKTGFDYSDILNRLLFDEWQDAYLCWDAKKLMEEESIEQYLTYRMHFYITYGVMGRHGLGVQERTMCEFEDKDAIVKYINDEIANVYNNNVKYDDRAMEDELQKLRDQIKNSDFMKYYEVVGPIETKLASMQYLIFGNETIRRLYKECWVQCRKKNIAWQTVSR